MIEKDNYELYFLNNLYDDTCISELLSSFKNRLYNSILRGKSDIQNNYTITGEASKIKVDQELNLKYDFPKNSYSLRLMTNIIPFYSEKEFIDNYDYGMKITAEEIRKEMKVFSKYVTFFIGDYLIFDVTYVITKNETILFIPNISESKSKDIQNILESYSEWTLHYESKSDYYYGYLDRSILFTENKIYTSTFTEFETYNKKYKCDYWTIYITNHVSSVDIMACATIIKHSDENGIYFEVPSEFKDMVFNQSGNLKCLIVNKPECTGSGSFVYSEESGNAIFQIPYQKNPIPVKNFIVWKYNPTTKQKLYPLINQIDISYPNIYDFTKMITDTSLYIEWLEPLDDVYQFDTYIQDYIDCYNLDFTSMIINNTAHSDILNYNPIEDVDITSEEYFNSSYKRDLRAWRLSKLISMMNDNPNRYAEAFHKMYYQNREIQIGEYTYEKYSHIYERSVMNTADQCNNIPQLIMQFSSPHTYIRSVNTPGTNRHAMLFINGRQKEITHSMVYKSELFIYFPTSYISNKNEIIQLEIGLDDNYDIDDITFEDNSTGGYFALKDTDKLDTKSIADLVFYRDVYNKYISPNSIKFKFKIYQIELKFMGSDFTDVLVVKDEPQILEDINNLIVVPTNYDYIILGGSAKTISLLKSKYYKKIDLSKLLINAVLPDYQGETLHIATTNFYSDYEFIYHAGDPICVIPNFKGMPNACRFHIYNNGILQSPSTYTIEFSHYDGDVTIIPTDMNYGILHIEYISYDESLLFENTISTLNNNGIINLQPILDTPFDLNCYKVFIDGYKIPSSSIHIIGDQTLITIDRIPYEYTTDSILSIYKQTMDDDPYEYEANKNFLGNIINDDETFKEYMISKYS